MSQERSWGDPAPYPAPSHAVPARRRRRRRRGDSRWLAAATGVGLAIGLAWAARDGQALPGPAQGPTAPIVSLGPSAVAGRAPEPMQDREQALRLLLQRRGEAVTAKSERQWTADVDPERPRARQQTDLFRRLTLLPWSSWDYEVRDTSVPLPAGPTEPWRATAWAVKVEVSYRLSGDQRDVHRSRILVLRPLNGRWVVARDLPDGDTRDPWDLGRIAVLKSAHTLLVVPASQEAQARGYLADVEAARRKVTQMWSLPWPRVSVVYLPADEESMAAMLGRTSAAGLEQVAAVTTGELLRGSGTADRVVLNPTAFAGFGRPERRVVLAHELTHVATRAGVRLAPPMWLEEGFADYVAYRGSGVTRRQIADSLLEQVEGGVVPERLPTASDFDPRQGDIGPAYAGAWLAVDLVAQRKGRTGLIDYYLSVCGVASESAAAPASTSASDDADARASEAFGKVLHMAEDDFVASWRQTLIDLAGPA